MPKRFKDKPLLVLVTGHFVVLYRGIVGDTKYPNLAGITDVKGLRRKTVDMVYAITKCQQNG
jgi:hypothetical protein